MTKTIGVSLPATAPARAASKSVLAALSVFAASTLTAAATEPGTANPGNTRSYSESGMLDAARDATARDRDRSVNIGIPPPDELRVLEARREAELNRLSDKLKRAEARGPAPVSTLDTPGWTTAVAIAPGDDIETTQRSALGATPAGRNLALDLASVGTRGRATILMMLAPREHRAFNAAGAADPILCVTDGCYVSNGAQAPATYHSLNQSLSFEGRISRGAGDCNHSLVCVFRNVEIGSDAAMVQPLDLKLVRGGGREKSEVAIDTSCRMIDNRLSCSRPVRTVGYTLWVVPEGLARAIGPEALTSAVSGGLRTSQTAELPWAQH